MSFRPWVWIGCLIAGFPATSAAASTPEETAAPATSPRRSALPVEAQGQLARRFAPVLIFHPEEKYLPCSPLFPLEVSAPTRRAAPRDASASMTLELLGDVRSRQAFYDSLDPAEKFGLATVYYQAYPLDQDDGERVVVEYWLYYVHNQYRVRAGLIPLAVDASHPNDAEHVFLILRPSGIGSAERTHLAERFAIEEILYGAHGPHVPNGSFRFPEGFEPDRTPPLLVELGGHAVAPDLDGDGRFTPGSDATSGGKFIWGIRDQGHKWAKYNPNYMLPRGNDATAIYHPGTPRWNRGGGFGATKATDGRTYHPYRLEHVDRLEAEFEKLELSDRSVEQIFQNAVFWFKRLLGRSDGSPKRLLLPSRHEDFRNPQRMRGGYPGNRRGLIAGYTAILSGHTFFVGGRNQWANDSSVVPNLELNGRAYFTLEGRDFYQIDVLGLYPIDASASLLVGGGLLTDSLRLENRQFLFQAGLELGFGRLRFRNTFRTQGEVSRAWYDFSVFFIP